MRYSEILSESARADLYHGTGVAGALSILRTGGFRGGRHYDDKVAVSLSRDPRWRFYKDPAGDFEGKAPIQFVLDGDALSRRFRVEPYAHISHVEGQYDWTPSQRHLNAYEERVLTDFIPLSFVKAIRIEATAFKPDTGWDDDDDEHVADERGQIKQESLMMIRDLASRLGIQIVAKSL